MTWGSCYLILLLFLLCMAWKLIQRKENCTKSKLWRLATCLAQYRDTYVSCIMTTYWTKGNDVNQAREELEENLWPCLEPVPVLGPYGKYLMPLTAWQP